MDDSEQDPIEQAAATLTPRVAAVLDEAIRDERTAMRLYEKGRGAHDPIPRLVIERIALFRRMHPGGSPWELLRELRAHESPLVLIIERVEQLVEARAA